MTKYKYVVVALTNDKAPFKEPSVGIYMALDLSDTTHPPKFVLSEWLKHVKDRFGKELDENN